MAKSVQHAGQFLSLLRLSDAVGMDDPEMDNAFDALFASEQDILS